MEYARGGQVGTVVSKNRETASATWVMCWEEVSILMIKNLKKFSLGTRDREDNARLLTEEENR